MNSSKDAVAEIENSDHEPYVFRLYITGASPNSSRAVSNFKSFCAKYLANRYELQIIDVYQQPQIVKSINIIAIPLLVKERPLPERRFIGDLSDQDKLLKSLNLTAAE